MFQYWGKTSDHGEAHLLAFHALDVAATFDEILVNEPRWRNSLLSQLGLPLVDSHDWLLWLVAVHDIGKYTPGFQNLSPETARRLGGAPVPAPYGGKLRHDGLGTWWFRGWLDGSLEGRGLARSQRRDACQSARELADAVFWHHGRPGIRRYAGLEAEEARQAWEDSDNGEGLRAANAFADVATGFLCSREHFVRVISNLDRIAARQTSFLLAGLVTLADWIGSNETWFPYRQTPMPLEEYWHKHARPQASRALHETGLHASRPPVAAGFRVLFPHFEPQPMQALADAVGLGEGPALVLIEDQTGTGKTEAALTIAHRLVARGDHRSVFVALPTMATANAMFTRCLEQAAAFSADGAVQVMLAHGMRDMNDGFLQLAQRGPGLNAKYGASTTPDAEQTASTACSAWLSDNRKKSMLAHLGVGTIDQALLSVLPIRYQSLRVAGLATSVLVVDEVHAYDSYMTELLARLLTFQRANGGSAILMSATFPRVQREKLVRAWQQPVAVDPEYSPVPDDPAPEFYPCMTTITSSEKAGDFSVEATASRACDIPIQWSSSEEEVANSIVQASVAGRACVWIRNTVDDARSAHTLLQELAPGSRIHLFHARFTANDRASLERDILEAVGARSGPSDRAGVVVVATQVIEQSLDVDFDFLATDLCPIDLLIQRAGRYRRHRRDATGSRHDAADERGDHCFMVLAPEWTSTPLMDWYSANFERAQFVYPRHDQLWHTMRVLREQDGLHLPRDARHLVEAVYGVDVEAPESLRYCEDTGIAADAVSRAAARAVELDLASGYGAHPDRWTTEAMTRLGLDSVRVRLVESSTLRPLPGCASWHESEVNVSWRSLVRLADSSDALQQLKDTLQHQFSTVMSDASLVFPFPVSPITSSLWGPSQPGLPPIHYSKKAGLLLADPRTSSLDPDNA